MLTKEVNERLTRVGPGTPMGNLLRRYWHPVAASVELEANRVLGQTLLGEDLVLFRTRKGHIGLVSEQCPHRGVSLACGIPEADGIRCAYHGWLFDGTGRCLEQPAEPPSSTFRNRIRIPAYPVQELGGLIWAYLGPQPPPLLPRYDLFVWDNVIRHIGIALVPCNWVQIMENSFDPVHAEYLHGHFMKYVLEKRGEDSGGSLIAHHEKIAFDVFEYGVVKRRLLAGQSEEAEDWKTGHPVVFPNILRVGTGFNPTFEIRVPVDDTHTRHYWYTAYRLGGLIPKQETVPIYSVPFLDDNGNFIIDFISGQDIMAWVTQGDIADRGSERLGTSDKGLILYRRLLLDEIHKVERGEDPLATVRDPAKNEVIELPQEETLYGGGLSQALFVERNHARYNPHWEEIKQLLINAHADLTSAT